MKEYLERDAVTQMIKKWADGYSYIEVPTEWAEEKARKIPAADVVEVVRCRDCANWQTDWYLNDPSKNEHYCSMIDLFTTGGFFCADGERKEKN